MKICSCCGKEKALSEFSPTSKYLGVVQYRADCKPCNAARAGAIRAANPDKAREILNRWRKKNPQKLAAQARRRKLRQYKITASEFDSRFVAQQGKCAICARVGLELCIDHEHESGKVRGLLCRMCNLGIGNLQDSVDNLQQAIKYLQSSR